MRRKTEWLVLTLVSIIWVGMASADIRIWSLHGPHGTTQEQEKAGAPLFTQEQLEVLSQKIEELKSQGTSDEQIVTEIRNLLEECLPDGTVVLICDDGLLIKWGSGENGDIKYGTGEDDDMMTLDLGTDAVIQQSGRLHPIEGVSRTWGSIKRLFR